MSLSMPIQRVPSVEHVEREGVPDDPAKPAIGKWYWLTVTGPDRDEDDEGGSGKGKTHKRFVCVTHVGSNYAEVATPDGRYNGNVTWRIHLDDFPDECEYVPNHEEVLQTKIASHQNNVRALMHEVQEVTARLAISMGPKGLTSGNETSALALRSPGESLDTYKSALVKAKDKTLPALFEKIKKENEGMGKWMQAQLIPMEAQAEQLEPAIAAVKGRIFNVELYAGLIEQIVEIKKGKPALPTERIRLFQRRCYMDEECLAQYTAGGMEFKDLDDFDEWLVRPDNLARLLPFPRCMVAFQVRRFEKERSFEDYLDLIRFILEGIAQQDKWTFLYMRNGEQVFRLATQIEFGAQLFPDLEHAAIASGQALYATDDGKSVMGEHQYLEMVEREKAAKTASEAKAAREKREFPAKMREWRAAVKAFKIAHRVWKKEHAEFEKKWSATWVRSATQTREQGAYQRRKLRKVAPKEPREPSRPYLNPFRDDLSWRRNEYSPFNSKNVHFDDIEAAIRRSIDEHNRLVLLLQGILDRSLAMHPHPVWRLWEADGFASALELVYDDSRTLVPGPRPDFEAYRARLNASIKPGTITIGQEVVWTEREAEKYNARNEYRDRVDKKHYCPPNDPGPGALARVVRVTKKGLVYEWTKQPDRWRRDYFGCRIARVPPVKCRLVVDPATVLNVDAYQAGDFKQFFADPRTRVDYLKWAPLLLEAEEYKAGNRKVSTGKEIDTND